MRCLLTNEPGTKEPNDHNNGCTNNYVDQICIRLALQLVIPNCLAFIDK